ncbi:hypothetical protein N9L47_10650 [Rhodobacteraceae bacterium]|nr:hypothetical protein [Paracoccaceae bacterium]
MACPQKGTPEVDQDVTLSQEDSFRKVFGTSSPEMAGALLGHCLKVLHGNERSDDSPGGGERIFMLSAVAEINSRNTFERMLAAQMAATHVAMIRTGQWLSGSDRLDQAQTHQNGYAKLARAYVAQMEALRKHRNGGKQTVTVQHVNVQDGGQAIVGNVGDQGRVRDEK